ncbi:hypothetical protein EHS25_000791 [Saitozyma podzolica]|uniref:GABA-specific high-affinity permease n=1 Tax=Saitozyma podzolica TaxID=1890683 RepID=A0A427YX92_9TREE|nr:hypothetical protein EHS25_000791 [Saitozyma podzolica]
MSDLHRHSINPVGADKADIESIGSDVKAPENVGTTVEAIDADDIARLAEHDHVRKNFKWWELICCCFCMNNVPAVCSLLLYAAFTNGGIPALLYGYILAYTGAFLTALAIAELASVIPTVGGVYHMAIWLAPPRWKGLAGWCVGLINWVGWMFQVSSTCVLAAQGFVSFVQVFNNDYNPDKWVTYLINLGIYLPMLLVNIWGIKWFGRIDTVVTVVQVFGIFAFLVAMLCKAHPLASAYSVFAEVRYSDPVNSLGNTMMLGFLAPVTCASGFDAAAHLAEEVKNPRKMVPRIMLLVVAMGGVCGIVVSLMLGFIASDITVILESSNYYPVVTLVYETLHSKAGAAIYCFIITLVAYNGTQGSLLVASRQLMALSADGCFPRKWRLHEISPRFQLPIISLVVCCLLNMAAGALYLSGSAGWNALNVACVASFNLSYVIVVLLAVWRGRARLPADRAFKIPTSVGNFTDAAGITYQLFSLVVLSFPSNLPFSLDVWNWGIVFELGSILAIWLIFHAWGRKRYEEIDIDKLIAIADQRDAKEGTTH